MTAMTANSPIVDFFILILFFSYCFFSFPLVLWAIWAIWAIWALWAIGDLWDFLEVGAGASATSHAASEAASHASSEVATATSHDYGATTSSLGGAVVNGAFTLHLMSAVATHKSDLVCPGGLTAVQQPC